MLWSKLEASLESACKQSSVQRGQAKYLTHDSTNGCLFRDCQVLKFRDICDKLIDCPQTGCGKVNVSSYGEVKA